MTRTVVAESWPVRPLSDVADIQTGIAKGKAATGATVEVPYLRVANVQDGHLDLTEMKTIVVEPAALDRYRLHSGDVLFTEGGDFDKLGRGCVWRGEIDPCLHQNHVFAVRTRTDLLPDFLAAHAASQRGRAYFLDCAKRTTNLASINSTQLKAFPVPLPPLPEQREIAATLKAVDDAIAAGEAVVVQLDVVWRSLVRQLMTQGVHEGRELRSTPVGHAPVGWTEVSIGDVAIDIAYGTSMKLDGGSGATPVLRIPNVVSGMVDVDLKYASLPDRDLESLRLVADDLLLVRTNGNPSYVGRSLLFPGREGTWAFASYLIRVRVDRNQVLPAFLHYALQAPGVRRSIERGIRTSAGNYNLNTQGIRATRFNLPPISEQQAIVDALRVVEVRTDKERAVLAERRRLKAALADALLTGRIRVPVPNGV